MGRLLEERIEFGVCLCCRIHPLPLPPIDFPLPALFLPNCISVAKRGAEGNCHRIHAAGGLHMLWGTTQLRMPTGAFKQGLLVLTKMRRPCLKAPAGILWGGGWQKLIWPQGLECFSYATILPILLPPLHCLTTDMSGGYRGKWLLHSSFAAACSSIHRMLTNRVVTNPISIELYWRAAQSWPGCSIDNT